MIRYSVTNGNQIIKEICEHCGEIISDLHISEITVKNPKDPRTIKIVGKDGSTKQVVPTKEDFLATKTGSYIREGLLDDGEKPKYGVRPVAMCSQSIDIVTGITPFFCGIPFILNDILSIFIFNHISYSFIVNFICI